MAAPTAAVVFDDYNTSGVPSSGHKKVKKSEARSWGAWLESFLTSIGANAGSVFIDRAALYGDLAHAANSMAWVLQDPTAAYNGIYRKQGASGVGSWSRVGDLPYSFIVASNAGAGTPNAIVATTSIPASASALVMLPIVSTNSGSPVTVSFNGAAPLTVKSNSVLDVSPGGLKAGSIVWGTINGTTFQLANDEAVATVIQAYRDQVAALVVDAQAAASASQGFATQAQLQAGYAEDSATEAQALVDAAEAGFTGFPSTAAYDFGSIADATTYFNQDWGSI